MNERKGGLKRFTLKPHGTAPLTSPGACARKEWFRNEGAAWREVFKLREVRNYPASLQPYCCNQCGRWHIGNNHLDRHA